MEGVSTTSLAQEILEANNNRSTDGREEGVPRKRQAGCPSKSVKIKNGHFSSIVSHISC